MADKKRIAELLRINDESLSRTTSSGLIDTTASADKIPALVTPQRGLRLVRRNRRLAAEYIAWRAAATAINGPELGAALITLAEIINLGISGGGIFRRWDLGERQLQFAQLIEPGEIPARVIEAAAIGFSKELGEPEDAWVRRVGGIEWEIGIGPLHPFQDGCGRVSRYYSMLISIMHSLPVVLHRSRSGYYEAGQRGKLAFSDYYVNLKRVAP